MVGKAPLQHLDAPSGYVSPVVYPYKMQDIRGNASDALATEGKLDLVANTPTTGPNKPPQGFVVPVIHTTLPFRFRPENLGILHLIGAPS